MRVQNSTIVSRKKTMTERGINLKSSVEENCQGIERRKMSIKY